MDRNDFKGIARSQRITFVEKGLHSFSFPLGKLHLTGLVDKDVIRGAPPFDAQCQPTKAT